MFLQFRYYVRVKLTLIIFIFHDLLHRSINRGGWCGRWSLCPTSRSYMSGRQPSQLRIYRLPRQMFSVELWHSLLSYYVYLFRNIYFDTKTHDWLLINKQNISFNYSLLHDWQLDSSALEVHVRTTNTWLSRYHYDSSWILTCTNRGTNSPLYCDKLVAAV